MMNKTVYVSESLDDFVLEAQARNVNTGRPQGAGITPWIMSAIKSILKDDSSVSSIKLSSDLTALSFDVKGEKDTYSISLDADRSMHAIPKSKPKDKYRLDAVIYDGRDVGQAVDSLKSSAQFPTWFDVKYPNDTKKTLF